MRIHVLRTARRLAVLLAIAAPATLAAQASAYIPLDDPMLPSLEHLIARGDVRDPTPMVRPFRRVDAQTVLRAADTTRADVRELLAWYGDAPRTDGDSGLVVHYRAAARGGFQAQTQARRDLLHPAGEGNIWPYVDFRLEAQSGPVVLVTRPGIENRVRQDPDWPGRRDNYFSGRLFEGYGSVQAGAARLMFGQLDRNWGPVGLPGFPISNVTYRREGWAFDFVTRDLQFTSYATQLADQRDSTGALVHRYYIVKRLGLQATRRLNVAVWDATVLQGVDRNFENSYLNPFSFAYNTISYGYGNDRSNNMIGADVSWRAFGRSTLQVQLAIDDIWIDQRNVNRDRFGATAVLQGPLGRRLTYRGLYSVASSLAFRTFDALENLTDGGVGLGRNFADNDQFTFTVGWPVTPRWLLTPELTLFRQGEGRINDPYPAPPVDPNQFPELFIGTVERTYRAAIGVAGRQGPLQVLGNIGVHHVVNSGNVAGVTKNRVEARIQATLNAGTAGLLH